MLNNIQQKAVEHIGSPLCILAGPGTGKTKTLEEKIFHLIKNVNIKPENIIAMTFTRSAATELLNRVVKKTKIHPKQINIGTFHSQCLTILKANATKCYRKANVKWLTPEQQEKRIFNILTDLSLTWNKNYLPAIRETLSLTKKQQQWNTDNTSYPEQIAKEIYNIYEFLLHENNEIDLDDMIIKVNQMFKEHPHILQTYKQQFQYVLVDEAQDMDLTQFEFINHLKCKNTTLVGDDDQAIYQFAGSSMKYLHKFIDEWDPKCLTLEQNYRNTQTTVNASSNMIKHNQNRKDKNISTKNTTGNKIKILETDNEQVEAEKTINIATSHNNSAILYRQNKQSKIYQEILIKKGIPYQILGETNLHERAEIKNAIAILTIMVENNPAAFQRMLSIQPGIGPKTVKKILQTAQNAENPLESLNSIDNITQEQHANLQHIKNIYEKEKDPITVIDKLMPKTEPHRQSNINKFKKQIQDSSDSLPKFLNKLKYNNSSPETIKLLTFHKSKGMEFENTFLTGFEQNLIPHQNTLYDNNNSNIEEERRLAYVALTRSSKNIFISYSKNRKLFEQRTNQSPSQFLKEIPQEYKEYI